MEKNVSLQKLEMNKTTKKIYNSIKENNTNFQILFKILKIFDIIEKIIIIDIIFSFKRKFINLYFPLYFCSPTFYFEALNSKFGNHTNSNILNDTYIETDQIYNIHYKYLKIEPIHQIDFFNYRILAISCLLLVIILYLIQLITTVNYLLNLCKKISEILIYLIFVSFNIPALIIFNRTTIMQFAQTFNKLKDNFIIDITLLIIFNCLTYRYYLIFVYAFDDNEKYFFIKSNYFLIKFLLNELGVILLVLRRENNYSIIFQFFWSCLFIINFFILSYNYIRNIHKKLSSKIIYFLNTLIFSLFITRFFSLFIIKSLNKIETYKIFETLLIILLTIVIFFNLSHMKKTVNLTKIEHYLKNNECDFFVGIYQLFNSFIEFFFIKIKLKKFPEKEKEKFFFNIKNDLINYFILSKEDLTFLLNNKMGLLSKFNSIQQINNFQTTTTTTNSENNITQITMTLLLNVIDQLYNLADEKNSNYGNLAKEVIIYYKVLLYYISDDSPYRSEYYLKKFLYNPNYDNSNILMNCIFEYLEDYFKKKEKDIEDNSMEYIIYFNLLNIEYLKIIKAFKIMLLNFNKSHKELIKILDIESKEIGNSLKNIFNINLNHSKNMKIKEQAENDKYKFVENIMFNNNYEKSLEYFDINNLDNLVDKNNYFINTNIGGNYICKKIPLLYYELTGIKTNKLYNQISMLIFPYIIRNNLVEIIENDLVNKRYCREETIIETIDHYIVYCRLTYNILPTYKGQLYYICLIEQFNFPENCNHILIEPSGHVLYLGLFYKNYLGICNTFKNFNIFNLFGIKDFNPTRNKVNFEIAKAEILKNVKYHLIKDGIVQNKEINEIIKKIKKLFPSKMMKIVMNVKKYYKINDDKIYLINFIFEDIKFEINQNNEEKSVENNSFLITANNNSSIASVSTNSYLSYKILKESSWNITNKRTNKNMSNSNLDKLNLYYNSLLIIIAIIICIIITIYSNKFKDDFKNMLMIREINNNYLTASIFIAIMIKIENSSDYYDSLNEYYNQNIDNYNITLSYFYQTNFISIENRFIENYIELKKKYNKINNNNLFLKEFELLTSDGIKELKNFYSIFELGRNYFYILSKVENFYQEIPQINYDDIENNFKKLNENQKYIYSLVYNSFNIFLHIFEILYFSKDDFSKKILNFKFLSLFLFIGFLALNILSLLLLYFSIQITNKKTFSIVEKIFKLTKRGKKFLLEKLKYCKGIIKNEIRSSEFIERLKEIDPKKKKSNSNKQIFDINLDNNNNKNENENKNNNKKNTKIENNNENTNNNNNNNNLSDVIYDDDMYLIQPTKFDKKVKYYFKTYKSVLKIIFILISIYIICFIVVFPLIFHYFRKFNVKLNVTNNLSDFQNQILIYYLEIRYSILVNNTDKQKNYDIFGVFTNFLYSNYTSLKQILINENNKDTMEYFNAVNANGTDSCEFFLYDDDMKYSLFEICKIEPIMQAKVETMISAYMNQLRRVFINFNISERTNEDIIKCYHSQIFQINNLNLIIFFLNYLNNLEKLFILPQINDLIDELKLFLIIVFIFLVFSEFFNYIGSLFFVTRKLLYSLNNYIIMERFFNYEITTNTKDKK